MKYQIKEHDRIIMPKRIPKALNQLDIKKLFNSIVQKRYRGKHKDFIRYRNFMLFYCSLILGLRPREVFNSKLENLDLVRRLWFIPKDDNKQRFSDFVYIPNLLYYPLIKYLEILKRAYPKTVYLFPTNRSRIDRSCYNKIFKAALKDSGLYKVAYIDGLKNNRSLYTPYSLRHTFCTNAYFKLRDIKKVSILARHKDLAMRTTSLYVHCIEDNLRPEVIKALDS